MFTPAYVISYLAMGLTRRQQQPAGTTVTAPELVAACGL